MGKKYGIMRFSKLKEPMQIQGLLKHAFREIPTPNADPTKENHKFKGMPGSFQEAYDKHLKMLPKKRRKDAVTMLEFMVTATDLQDESRERQIEYLTNALRYLAHRCGGRQNVVHAEIHFDETTPHLTAFITPINEFGRLSGASMVGKTPQEVREFQNDFYEKVAKPFGFARGEIRDEPRKHETLKSYMAKVDRLEKENAGLREQVQDLSLRLARYEPANQNVLRMR